MIVRADAYSFASLEVRIEAEGLSFTTLEFTEVEYDDEQEPGELRGTSSEILGRTRGEYKPTGKLKLSKKEHARLLTALGNGFYRKSVDVIVTYDEPQLGLIVDSILGCRPKKNSGSNSKGNDPSEAEMELSPLKILWNGIDGSAVEE
jgi:hypothetical protein